MIHEENDIIKMPGELASVKMRLKQGKHTYLVMRTEHPRAYEDSVVTKPLQDSGSNLTIEVLYEFHLDRWFPCHSMH